MRNKQAGFTLLELLIAMTVFAIMSVMVYTALNNVLRNKAQVEVQADRLVALQQTFTFLERDIEQITNRKARDSFGDPQPSLQVGTFGSAVLALSRNGYTNPAGLPRSQLQRVEYLLDEKKFTRQFWPVVDRAPNSEPVKRVLLEGVESIKLRFLHGTQWLDSWPPLANVKPDEFPIAIEAVIELPGFGKVRRLFRLPDGSAGLL